VKVRDLRRATYRDLLWNFAYSEIDSVSRHGDAWRAAVGPTLTQRLAISDSDRISVDDWSVIERTLLATRGWFLASLLALEPSWYSGVIELEQVGSIQVLRHPPFLSIAPSGRIGDFVRALDAGEDTPGDRFAARYRALQPVFTPARARGRPVLVTPTLDGPFTEIDGLTRLSILWSRRRSAPRWPTDLPVMLGVGPTIAQWPFYCPRGGRVERLGVQRCRSIRTFPLRKLTPSTSSRTRCSRPSSPARAMRPPAATTRCHGSPSDRWRAQTVSRAARGKPAARATSP
jgi:hypothetical protein